MIILNSTKILKLTSRNSQQINEKLAVHNETQTNSRYDVLKQNDENDDKDSDKESEMDVKNDYDDNKEQTPLQITKTRRIPNIKNSKKTLNSTESKSKNPKNLVNHNA